MQFRGGMNELMRQAARMQRRIDQVKTELKEQELTAGAVGEKVKVTVSLEGKLRAISIDPAFLEAEGLELALDAVVAAANQALDEADKKVDAEVNKVTGGIKIPGM